MIIGTHRVSEDEEVFIKRWIEPRHFQYSFSLSTKSVVDTRSVKNVIRIPTKRFRLSTAFTSYHEALRMEPDGSPATSRDFLYGSVGNALHETIFPNYVNGWAPCVVGSADTQQDINGSGEKSSITKHIGWSVGDGGLWVSASYSYKEGETESLIGPRFEMPPIDSYQEAAGEIRGSGIHAGGIVNSVKWHGELRKEKPINRISNSVAYGSSASGCVYATCNTGTYVLGKTQITLEFHQKYEIQKIPCVDPLGGSADHTDHSMYSASGGGGTVNSSIYTSSYFSNILPKRRELPMMPISAAAHLHVDKGYGTSDRYSLFTESTLIDAFLVDRYEMVNGVLTKTHMRWHQPQGVDEYPQHVNGNIYSARDVNGVWTARAQCYEESPGRIVIGHWANKAGVKRKAVYSEASNTVSAEDAGTSWLIKHFFKHKIDGNWIQKFVYGGKTWMVMFPGWGAAPDERPWVDPFDTGGDGGLGGSLRGWKTQYDDRAEDLFNGVSPIEDGEGYPWLVLWEGDDLRVDPTMAFNMGSLYMTQLDFVHRIDETGFVVKGTSIPSIECSKLTSVAWNNWNNRPYGSSSVFKKADWTLPVTGGVGDKSGIIVDARHLFDNDPKRVIDVNPDGRLYPIRVDMSRMVQIPFPEFPNNYTIDYVDVNLHITTPGLYSVCVDDTHMMLDGMRGCTWMRIIKDGKTVMPDPRMDPPKDDGTIYRYFMWIRSGRIRVKAGEEGVYTLRIACDMRGVGFAAPKYSDAAFGSNYLDPFRAWDPSASSFKTGTYGKVGSGNAAKALGDIIIPLRFGVAQ